MTTPEELRGDIERTRDQLGETVEALVAKADVKARAQHKVAEVKAGAQRKGADAAGHITEAADQVTQKAKDLTEQLPAAPGQRSAGLIVAGVAMLAVAWLILRRARRAA